MRRPQEGLLRASRTRVGYYARPARGSATRTMVGQLKSRSVSIAAPELDRNTLGWLGRGSVLVERGQLVRSQLEVSGRGGVENRLRPLGSRNWNDHGRLGQLPGQRHLLGAHAAVLGHLLKGRVVGGQLLGVRQPPERAPGQES